MQATYDDLSNEARNILFIIPHGVAVETSFTLTRDVIGWRQWKTTGKTVHVKVVVRQFAGVNIWMMLDDDSAFDMTNTENNLEIMREAEERKLHRMAMVHNFLEMWQGSRNLRATQKKSPAQTKQMTAVGYISDTEEIINAWWSHFQHVGGAAYH